MKKHLPSGWQEFKLGDITKVFAGGTPSTKIKEYWNGNILWLTSGELNNKKIYTTKIQITKKGLENSSARIIPIKSVLIGLAGQGKTRGTVAINYVELCTNQSVASILPNKHFIQEYLYYQLDMRYKELRSLSYGDGGRGGLNLKILNDLIVTVPPLDEQKRISDILSTFDDLIENLTKLIEKKEIYKKGVMQRVLSGEVRFNGFTDEWKTVKLKDILIAGSKDRVPDTSKYKKITIKLHNKGIEFSNIERKMADKRPFYIRKKDEIIIGKQNYFNGSIAIVDEEFDNTICSNAIMSFTVNKDCNNKFIYFLLSRKSYMQKYYHLANGTGQKELSESDFLNFNLLIPSLEEQNKIAELLTLIDKDIEILKQILQLRKLQKKGVMQKLLTGEVRV